MWRLTSPSREEVEEEVEARREEREEAEGVEAKGEEEETGRGCRTKACATRKGAASAMPRGKRGKTGERGECH